MAMWDDLAKGLGGSGGLLTGLGVLVLAPVVLPLAGRVLRPVAKSALQTGIVAYREIQNAASELVEEARTELHAESAAAPKRKRAARHAG